MKPHIRLLMISSLLWCSHAAPAQDVSTCMKWDFKLTKQEYKVGDEMEVLFTVSLKEGWKLVLANPSDDSQSTAVRFEFAENGSFEVLNQVQCQSGLEKPAESVTTKFSQSVFRSRVRVVEDTFDLHGYVRGHLFHESSGQKVAFQQYFRF